MDQRNPEIDRSIIKTEQKLHLEKFSHQEAYDYLKEDEARNGLDTLVSEVQEYEELFQEELAGKDPEILISELGLFDELQDEFDRLSAIYAERILDRLKIFMEALPELSQDEMSEIVRDKEVALVLARPLWQELEFNLHNSLHDRYKDLDKLSRTVIGWLANIIKNKVTTSYYYHFINDHERKFDVLIEETEIHKSIIAKLRTPLNERDSEEEFGLREILTTYPQIFYWRKFIQENQEKMPEEGRQKYQEIGARLFAQVKEIARTNQVPFAFAHLGFGQKDRRMIFSSWPISSFSNVTAISRIGLVEEDFDISKYAQPQVVEDESPDGPIIMFDSVTEKGVDLGVSRIDGQLTAGFRTNLGLKRFFENLKSGAVYDRLHAEIMLNLYRLLRNKDIGEINLDDYETAQDFLQALDELEREAKPFEITETDFFYVIALPSGLQASRAAQEMARDAGISLGENQSIQFKHPNRTSPEDLIESVVLTKEKKKGKEYRLSRLTYHELASALRKLGCQEITKRGKGEHVLWQNPAYSELDRESKSELAQKHAWGKCPIPKKKGELGKGLIVSILRELGLKREDFLKALHN